MEPLSHTPKRRCIGRTANLRRCARTGPWRFFCHDHQYQWISFLFFLVFTMGTGTLAYYQFFSESHAPDTEAIAIQLKQDIRSRFETEAEAGRAAGQHWETIRELERRRDAALRRVDEIILIIKEGLAGKPSPIFTEATGILVQDGAEAAIAYLESHKVGQLARAERAASQVQVAQVALQRELQPLILQSTLHETRFELEQALALMQTVADKAPQWFEARNRLGMLLYTLARYTEAEPHQRAAVYLAQTRAEEAVALNELAQLLQDTNWLDEAEPLMRQMIEILLLFGLRTEHQHPHMNNAIGNYRILLSEMGRDESEHQAELESLIESVKNRISQ